MLYYNAIKNAMKNAIKNAMKSATLQYYKKCYVTML